MWHRLQRKLAAVRRYPVLAHTPADRRALWLLGLVRNRLLGLGLARTLSGDSAGRVTPRLNCTQGQAVSLQLGHQGQVDCFDELFIERIYDLSAVPFVADLVADCGAYCGYFAALAAGWLPGARIVCFEANPDNLPMLRTQLELLAMPAELVPAAVYTRSGQISFAGAGVGGAVRENAAAPGTRTIPCLDFPAWLREQSPHRLVWKLDVEGAERELLPACLPVLPPETVCYLETHHPDAVCSALLAPYRAAGFAVREIRRRQASAEFDYVEWILVRRLP